MEETGRRYADRHRSVLIRRAKALLSDETLPIGRIGVELGYADAAHFSRAFLNWTGATPSDWRRAERRLTTGEMETTRANPRALAACDGAYQIVKRI